MKRLSDTRYAELFSHPYFVKGLLTHFVDEQFIADLDFTTRSQLLHLRGNTLPESLAGLAPVEYIDPPGQVGAGKIQL